jgi:hypothetical protein
MGVPAAPIRQYFKEFLCLGNLVIRHQFNRTAQRRMIEPAHAIGGTAIHQLLRGSRVRQRYSKFLGALQCKIQVLLVQSDAEAGLS